MAKKSWKWTNIENIRNTDKLSDFTNYEITLTSRQGQR